jgi:phosphoribosylformylglycinamidine synthase
VSKARVLIPTGFGVNCEAETAQAFRLAGAAEVELVHLTDLFARRTARRIPDYDVLAFIGGFSYGDHVAAGFVQAARIRAHLAEDLSEFLARGGRVIGICNGFQTLVRLGLLPGPADGPPDFVPRAVLNDNDRLGYRNAWVRVAADPASKCVWTRGAGVLEVPARHGEGRFLVDDDDALARLESRGQVALRYVDAAGRPTEEWPFNPNGSRRGVAGICDTTGRVFGVMPHPEAFVLPWQHPDWRHRQTELEARGADGLALFRTGLLGT